MKVEDWLNILEDLYKKQEPHTYKLSPEIEETFKALHDWCMDHEPDYVPLCNLLLFEIIRIEARRYHDERIYMDLPKNFHLLPYFNWSLVEYNSIMAKSLLELFNGFVDAHKKFKEIWNYDIK